MAERSIYLESQFLRSHTITRALVRARRARPRLDLIVLLPAAPEDIAFEGARTIDARFGEKLQARSVRRLMRAFGDRLAMVAPAQPWAVASDGRDALHGAGLVYVHAKVLIADEAAAVVSSANLNGRSLRWDSEAGVEYHCPDRVKALRDGLFAKWLGPDASPAAFGLEDAAEAWRRLAAANAERPPAQRQGFLLPYDVAAAEAAGAPAPGVPEELV